MQTISNSPETERSKLFFLALCKVVMAGWKERMDSNDSREKE